MSGNMKIVLDNAAQFAHDLQAIKAKSEKVVARTVADAKTRGPSWVAQEVVKEYNIKKKDVNETRAGTRNSSSVKIAGTNVSDLQLVYRGRLLTPTHFGMKPTSRPSGKGYTVTAQIKKSGGRKPLGTSVFLANSGAEGTTQIPFKRVGAARLPVKAVKTLSVPQMITNDAVSEAIKQRISAELSKRLEHNLQRMLKK